MKRHPRARRAIPNMVSTNVQKPSESTDAEVPRRGADGELHKPAGRPNKQRTAPHGLMLAPLVGDVLTQWSQAFAQLGVSPELRPKGAPRQGLAVVTETGVFMAGAGIYDTAGPWVLIEHLATNPMAPARLKHQAVMWLGRGVLASCTAMNKQPIVFVRSRGLAMVMLRLGGQISQSAVVIGGIGLKVQ